MTPTLTRATRSALVVCALVLSLLAAVLPSSGIAAAPTYDAPRETTPVRYRMYLHGFGSDGVVGYRLTDATQSAALIPGSQVPSGLATWPQSATPDGRFLYLASGGSRRVYAYEVGDRGDLTAIAGAETFPIADLPTDMEVGPDGQFGFVAQGLTRGTIQPFRIRSSGVPVPNGPAVPLVGSDSGVSSLSVSPDGRSLFVSDFRENQLSRYAIDEHGRLSGPKSQVSTGAGPLFPTLSPDRRFVYTTNERGRSMSGYRLTSTGALRELPGSPFPAGEYPHGLAFSSDGRFLYTPNAQGGSVSGYEVRRDGGLVPLPGSPFPYSTGPAGAQPEMVVMSPTDRVLWVFDLLPGITDGSPDSALRKYWVRRDGRLVLDPDTVIRTGLLFGDGRTMTLLRD